MASLSVSSANGTTYFTISGLTSGVNYLDLGVALNPATGTIQFPSEIIYSSGAYSTPPTSYSDSFILPPGTFTFYGYARTYDGIYWPAGSHTYTIPSVPFAWDVPKTVGSSTITVIEWDKLINFVVNKVGEFDYTRPFPGDALSALKYNQLINGMGASPSYLVSAGQAITAAKLNLLVTLANNL